MPVQVASRQTTHKLDHLLFHDGTNSVFADANAVEVAQFLQIGRGIDFLNHLPDALKDELVLHLFQIPREALAEGGCPPWLCNKRKTSARVAGFVCWPSRMASASAKSSSTSAKTSCSSSRCSCKVSTRASFSARLSSVSLGLVRAMSLPSKCQVNDSDSHRVLILPRSQDATIPLVSQARLTSSAPPPCLRSVPGPRGEGFPAPRDAAIPTAWRQPSASPPTGSSCPTTGGPRRHGPGGGAPSPGTASCSGCLC